MPARSAEERERRRKLHEERKEQRRLKKEKEILALEAEVTPKTSKNADSDDGRESKSLLFHLPEDSLKQIMCCLSSADLGNFTLASRKLHRLLPSSRVQYLLSRLRRPQKETSPLLNFLEMLESEDEARLLIEQSYGGGETGRIIPKGVDRENSAAEFVAYARFIEESVLGYSPLGFRADGAQAMVPLFVHGRFASVSPEHSIIRIGGDGEKSGAGGSGVASWGVGKRGQLGHRKREDERTPRRLLGGIGYGLRIVQVSAGGGLVRVAHTLLLTSMGRVLSFGNGQYGALGHGYSAAKQLPDVLKPRYIEALNLVRCICVSAGELHSAAVSVDGDLYTWGDGFCGQLGHGDKRPQLLPKQVETGALEDESIASVSCGSRHTLAVTEDGEVFSWGLGHFGVLGRSYTPFEYDADTAVMGLEVDEEDRGEDVAEPATPATPATVDSSHDVSTDENQPPDQTAAFHSNSPNSNEDIADGTANTTTTTITHENEASDVTQFDDVELQAHLDLINNLTLDDASDQCIPKVIDSLVGVKIIGASAGHRHSLVLDENGSLFSFGAGRTGCLGHGDNLSQMFPVLIAELMNLNVRVIQMSAGVDMSMAVSTKGEVFAWGKTDGGRLGLGLAKNFVSIPRRLTLQRKDGQSVKAVDVECGYVHSLIVGLDGTIHMCGRVGVEGEADGEILNDSTGEPVQIDDINIWHRIPEPKEKVVSKERWKKYGKYEVKGRRNNL